MAITTYATAAVVQRSVPDDTGGSGGGGGGGWDRAASGCGARSFFFGGAIGDGFDKCG